MLKQGAKVKKLKQDNIPTTGYNYWIECGFYADAV